MSAPTSPPNRSTTCSGREAAARITRPSPVRGPAARRISPPTTPCGRSGCLTHPGRGGRSRLSIDGRGIPALPSPPMRRTKIVATIGPACRDPETLARMVEAGLDVARLNFSHGSREEHAENVRLVREASSRVGRQVAVLQDLPGPKLRIGPVRGDLIDLRPGSTLTLVCGSEEPGDEHRISIGWSGLSGTVETGDVIYLADGRIRLRVVDVRDGDCE